MFSLFVLTKFMTNKQSNVLIISRHTSHCHQSCCSLSMTSKQDQTSADISELEGDCLELQFDEIEENIADESKKDEEIPTKIVVDSSQGEEEEVIKASSDLLVK